MCEASHNEIDHPKSFLHCLLGNTPYNRRKGTPCALARGPRLNGVASVWRPATSCSPVAMSRHASRGSRHIKVILRSEKFPRLLPPNRHPAQPGTAAIQIFHQPSCSSCCCYLVLRPPARFGGSIFRTGGFCTLREESLPLGRLPTSKCKAEEGSTWFSWLNSYPKQQFAERSAKQISSYFCCDKRLLR